jgi:oxygen-independent coproporphyrinogen-3 oxidase
VTVECNPTSVDERHFAELLEAGVGRVSIGVQAVDERRLAFLGRLHDARGGLRALAAARLAGVPRISGDLIFGLHGQSPAEAVRDAELVLAEGVTHLSAYALTIEPGTRFGALHRRGRLPLLEDELVAESLLAVSVALRARGLRHYEVSNYALRGQESRHNLGYWTGQDYLGVGAGAFGTVPTLDPASGARGRVRYRNLLAPERYLAAWQERRTDPFASALVEREDIPAEVGVKEALMLGLRLEDGLEIADVEERLGAPVWTPQRLRAAAPLLASGQLLEEDGRLRIPRQHWLRADAVVRTLL